MKKLLFVTLIVLSTVSNCFGIEHYDLYDKQGNLIASNVQDVNLSNGVYILCDQHNDCITVETNLIRYYEPTGGLLKEETLEEELNK